MRYCNDCKWRSDGAFGGSFPRCARPGTLDPVTGSPSEYCSTERMGKPLWLWGSVAYLMGICGPQARFFEPKEA